MAYRLPDVRTVSQDDEETCAVDCTLYLDPSETISTVSGTLEEGSGVTISNEGPNAAEFPIEGETVAVGKAAVWDIAGQTADTRFVVRLRITTSMGRVFNIDAPFQVAP